MPCWNRFGDAWVAHGSSGTSPFRPDDFRVAFRTMDGHARCAQLISISMMHFAWTPSENARSARAELETIAAALPADAIAELVAIGRRLLDADDARIAAETAQVI